MISSCFDELCRYKTLYVGLSGGLDSVVLLHCLIQHPAIKTKLVAIHVHHGLSLNADLWENHSRSLCETWNVPFKSLRVQIDASHNIENHARMARYDAFSSFLTSDDALLLAHHQNDQAETLLLQLCRGSGLDGLSAMPIARRFAKGVLIRPLLDYPRATLEAYANTHFLAWVEDESNQNLQFSRNFVRHEVLPLLQKRWPNIVNQLATCSKICQNATKNLEWLAQYDAEMPLDTPILDFSAMPLDDSARILNVLQHWLRQNQVSIPHSNHLTRLLHEVILARQDATAVLSFGNVSIRRHRKKLYLVEKSTETRLSMKWINFPEPYLLSNGWILQATAGTHGVAILKGSAVDIRSRLGGERLRWHGQTKSLKKLFQSWDIPPWRRDVIPLIYIDNKLKVVVEYAYADDEADISSDNLRYHITLRRCGDSSCQNH